MKYKNFEIRPTMRINGKTVQNRYDVVKWCKREKPIEGYNLRTCKNEMSDTHCYTIAQFFWNEEELCWEFEAIGIRFLENYEGGLCQFILKYIELLDICREGDNEY